MATMWHPPEPSGTMATSGPHRALPRSTFALPRPSHLWRRSRRLRARADRAHSAARRCSCTSLHLTRMIYSLSSRQSWPRRRSRTMESGMSCKMRSGVARLRSAWRYGWRQRGEAAGPRRGWRSWGCQCDACAKGSRDGGSQGRSRWWLTVSSAPPPTPKYDTEARELVWQCIDSGLSARSAICIVAGSLRSVPLLQDKIAASRATPKSRGEAGKCVAFQRNAGQWVVGPTCCPRLRDCRAAGSPAKQVISRTPHHLRSDRDLIDLFRARIRMLSIRALEVLCIRV
ncbi:hypothetical protein BC826DRAFT_1025719 [Russula brevipes]|nr:hypothetical protein BC826DRAFT_1025719 [Russula brevipes]